MDSFGSKEPASAVLAGRYADVIISDSDIITIRAKRYLVKVHATAYKNTVSGKPFLVGRSGQRLVDDLRTGVLDGDIVYLGDHRAIEIICAMNGLEIHVMVHPSGDPPERFVIGCDKTDGRYRIRHDDPFKLAKTLLQQATAHGLQQKPAVHEPLQKQQGQLAVASELPRTWQLPSLSQRMPFKAKKGLQVGDIISVCKPGGKVEEQCTVLGRCG